MPLSKIQSWLKDQGGWWHIEVVPPGWVACGQIVNKPLREVNATRPHGKICSSCAGKV